MCDRNIKNSYNKNTRRFFCPTVISFLTFVIGTSAVAQQQVNFEVIGTVQSYCAFDSEPYLTADSTSNISIDMDSDARKLGLRDKKVGLSLTCNAPFSVSVISSQGGLTNSNIDAKAISGGFTRQIGYQATVNITTEDTSTPFVLTCQSDQMAGHTSSCRASSGSNTAIGDGAGVGEVSITLSDSAQKPLQGRYQDTIFLALALQ